MKSAFRFLLHSCSLVVLAILAISPVVQAGSAGTPEKADANPATSPFDLGWYGGYYNNGTNSYIQAVAVDGLSVYVAGNFTAAGNVVANFIAMWDGAGWHPLGSGVGGGVSSLALDGRGNLYVGGYFEQAGGKPANHIARWDGQQWEPLGTGVDRPVLTLGIDSCGNVYAGGWFNFAGDVEAHGIARWDGSNWHSMGDGFSSPDGTPLMSVDSLAVDRFGFVYAGGAFTHADGKLVNNVARWDGTHWTALGSGISGESQSTEVFSLAVDNRGKLFAGGQFTSAGGVTAHNLAVWDGENWAEVGGGVESNQTDSLVNYILTDGGNIYVGGQFDFAGGSPVGQIAKWNGSTWENMNGGVYSEEQNPSIFSMTLDRDGNLIVGGLFSLAGGKNANYVALWDGTDWSALGTDRSVNGRVSAMISDRHGGFYIAGAFVAAGGQVVNHVAHWDGNTWSGLAGGLSAGQYGALAYALALDSKGNLYVGGAFTTAGNTPANNIAKWVGDHWEMLGSGTDGYVYELAVDSQDNLYVSGGFETAGGVPARNIAKWTGTDWEVLGNGLDSPPKALAVDAENRLIAGGDFYSYNAGKGVSYNLARWDGSTWEILNNQFAGPVDAILVDGDILYLGGLQVWRFQNGAYEGLGEEFFSTLDIPYILSLTLDDQGRLVAGGQFTQVGDVLANNIARWDGNRWEPLGNGTDGTVNALLIDDEGRLQVAGEFSQAGGKVSSYLARWQDPFAIWMPGLFAN